MTELMINPFNNSAIKQQSNATTSVEEQRAIAETQGAMIIAKKFPRSPMEAMDKILQACTRKSLAETALYSYSKGGAEVTGASIRLAEVAAQCWGNMQFGIRELEQREGESTVEAFAWDVESNTRQVKVFQVTHERHTKSGVKKLTDPRDIYELVANQGARRLRACILGVIPGDVIEAAQNQCEVTMKSNADTSPEGIKKMSDAFMKEFSVSTEMLQKRIQCRLDSIRPAQVIQLRKIFQSLKDGMSNVSDWFEINDKDAHANVKAKKTLDEIKKETNSTNKQTGEIDIEQEIINAINAAKTSEEVNAALKNVDSIQNEERRNALIEKALSRSAELDK